jgi:hypothetical protein
LTLSVRSDRKGIKPEVRPPLFSMLAALDAV